MNKTDISILEIALIFCFAMLILQYTLKYVSTQFSKRKGRNILKSFNEEEFKKIEVKISGLATRGFVNSTLFYSEDTLIFTQNENFNFEEVNFTLPYVIKSSDVEDFIIKSDEYILRTRNSRYRKEIQIYSEKENDLLNVIINNFKNRSHNMNCVKNQIF